MKFAQIESAITIAVLLKKYTIHLANKSDEKDLFDTVPLLTLKPLTSVGITFKPRATTTTT